MHSAALSQVDYDLIEVTVKWKSISPNRIFTADSYTDIARMVITGGAGAMQRLCRVRTRPSHGPPTLRRLPGVRRNPASVGEPHPDQVEQHLHHHSELRHANGSATLAVRLHGRRAP